jgi:hypothetical protein
MVAFSFPFSIFTRNIYHWLVSTSLCIGAESVHKRSRPLKQINQTSPTPSDVSIIEKSNAI